MGFKLSLSELTINTAQFEYHSLKMAIPGLFFFISVFSIVKHALDITGFELLTSSMRTNSSDNWATTTAYDIQFLQSLLTSSCIGQDVNNKGTIIRKNFVSCQLSSASFDEILKKPLATWPSFFIETYSQYWFNLSLLDRESVKADEKEGGLYP